MSLSLQYLTSKPGGAYPPHGGSRKIDYARMNKQIIKFADLPA